MEKIIEIGREPYDPNSIPGLILSCHFEGRVKAVIVCRQGKFVIGINDSLSTPERLHLLTMLLKKTGNQADCLVVL